MNSLHNSVLIAYGARRARGFTMVELVTTVIIVGLLGALVAPRFFDRNTFDSRGFHDQIVSALRYAQQAAIAQNRYVCAAFSVDSVTLTVGSTPACGTALTGPAGLKPYKVSGNNASFTATPAAFYFDALGKPYKTADTPPVSTFTKQTITVSGYGNIIIEMETGYVH